MSKLTKCVLKVDHITVLADEDYYNGKDIFECEQNDISCPVEKNKPWSIQKRRKIFYKRI